MNKKEKFKKILLFALMFLLPLISMKATTIDSNNYAYGSVNTENVVPNITKESIENLIVNEATLYIKKHYGNCPETIPVEIVKQGLINNIDICFMLAQTQLETTFGKAGVGRTSSRRSLFGVEKRFYKTYEEAISDYIRILTTSYLVKNRTEQDLLKRYVNKGGYRYAANKKYEIDLKKNYNNIIHKTSIKTLQEQYKKL